MFLSGFLGKAYGYFLHIYSNIVAFDGHIVYFGSPQFSFFLPIFTRWRFWSPTKKINQCKTKVLKNEKNCIKVKGFFTLSLAIKFIHYLISHFDKWWSHFDKWFHNIKKESFFTSWMWFSYTFRYNIHPIIFTHIIQLCIDIIVRKCLDLYWHQNFRNLPQSFLIRNLHMENGL